MRKAASRMFVLSLALLWGVPGASARGMEHEGQAAESFGLNVDAGRFDRSKTPIQFELDAQQLPPALAEQVCTAGCPALAMFGQKPEGPCFPAQLERIEDRVRITFVLPEAIPSGEVRQYQWLPDAQAVEGRWTFGESSEGHLELSLGDRPVFRYNTRPVSHPDFDHPNQPRDAYIHPAYTPSGAVITGDYSHDSHPHHRGFFLAYTRTEVGDLNPDFWNIQSGSGKVHFERLGPVVAGPVSARFSAFHRWDAQGEKVVLNERWDVEAFDIPDSPYYLFDLTSTQQAIDTPMILPPYRYGGMAYRGPDSFAPQGVLDVLTSEGLDRVQGDQKPARWVDLTGPVELDGREFHAGAAMFDHPHNENHPTPARIHPTRIPFFCYVPSHDEVVTIRPDAPSVFRYRILLHDGRPDADRNESLWRDFAEPPEVSVAENVEGEAIR